MSHETISSRNFFYKKIEVDNDTFDKKLGIDLGFSATHIIIVNGETRLNFAFRFPDNSDGDGELEDCEDITFDGLSENRLWFTAEGKTSVKVWAWRRG